MSKNMCILLMIAFLLSGCQSAAITTVQPPTILPTSTDILPTPTSVPSPTNIPPSSTPVPTPTRIPPTKAPPTRTPIVDYMVQIEPVMRLCSKAMGDFVDLNSIYRDDPSIVLDEYWKKDMLDVLDEYRICSTKIRGIENVPGDYKDTHNYFIKMADEMDLFQIDYLAWMESFDYDRLKDAQEHTYNVEGYVDLAIKSVP